MSDNQVLHPFKTPFLSSLTFAPETMPFTDAEIYLLDKELTTFEQAYLNPEVERTLISKNELLASFAISKAENSELTIKEAEDVYALLISDSEFDFIGKKLEGNHQLTQKDHDKLEFYNIAKTFRAYNQLRFSLDQLKPEFILGIHRELTQGMDIFKDYLLDFTIYKSGKFRDNDEIRVGSYVPAPFSQIKAGVNELIAWLQYQPSPTAIAQFHTALYALHPFNNGNKRVCRILEHLLFRAVGINHKNLYSTAYYGHLEKARYYKYLLYSLERYNLNHFVGFCLEVLVVSMMSVIKTSIEVKRDNYLSSLTLNENIIKITKPLIKRRELQFKQLIKMVGKKMARQTFVDSLAKAVELKALSKRDEGGNTYYSIPVSIPEVPIYDKWLATSRKKLTYIPDELLLL